ncbi:MAG TPA: radical SAM protein [Myxococcota bacterium]|nr:radical SAM protein [Myxococcota bacterium]
MSWVGPDGRVMRRLELHLTYTCPQACVFCSEDHRMQRFRKFPVTWGRVAATLREHAAHGVDHLHLTGGEPTIHTRLLDVLALARKLGMRTSIGTIGARLAREDFAALAFPLLDTALFSLHGPTAELHDRLTSKAGSFERQLRAMELAERHPTLRCANTVVCKDNIERLPETVDFLDRAGVSLIVVSNTTPEGAALDRYEELAVTLEVLAEVLPKVRTERATLRFFGVPMCVLSEDQRMLSNDLHWDPRVTVEWTAEPDKVVYTGQFNWTPARKRSHVEECAQCSLRGVCMGVYTHYAELWPTTALCARPAIVAE